MIFKINPVGSLTSVGAGAGLPPNRGWMVRFPERLQVYRGFPERGSRLRGAVARIARWIWRGVHGWMCVREDSRRWKSNDTKNT